MAVRKWTNILVRLSECVSHVWGVLSDAEVRIQVTREEKEDCLMEREGELQCGVAGAEFCTAFAFGGGIYAKTAIFSPIDFSAMLHHCIAGFGPANPPG